MDPTKKSNEGGTSRANSHQEGEQRWEEMAGEFHYSAGVSPRDRSRSPLERRGGTSRASSHQEGEQQCEEMAGEFHYPARVSPRDRSRSPLERREQELVQPFSYTNQYETISSSEDAMSDCLSLSNSSISDSDESSNEEDKMVKKEIPPPRWGRRGSRK